MAKIMSYWSNNKLIENSCQYITNLSKYWGLLMELFDNIAWSSYLIVRKLECESWVNNLTYMYQYSYLNKPTILG